MIATSLAKSVRRAVRAGIFMGMIPLVILNGWPVGGCMCADGHCPGCVSRAGKTAAVVASGSRSCCQRVGHVTNTQTNGKRPCCNSRSCCERSSPRSAPGPSVKCPCCAPVAQNPATPVVKVSPPTVHLHGLPSAVATDLPSLAIAAHHGRPVESDTRPPPSDLVVTLQRLLI
jgi:hypothetical protein